MTNYEKIKEALIKAKFQLYEDSTPTFKTESLSGIKRTESWYKYATRQTILVEVYFDGKAEMFSKTLTLNLKK